MSKDLSKIADAPHWHYTFEFDFAVSKDVTFEQAEELFHNKISSAVEEILQGELIMCRSEEYESSNFCYACDPKLSKLSSIELRPGTIISAGTRDWKEAERAAQELRDRTWPASSSKGLHASAKRRRKGKV